MKNPQLKFLTTITEIVIYNFLHDFFKVHLSKSILLTASNFYWKTVWKPNSLRFKRGFNWLKHNSKRKSKIWFANHIKFITKYNIHLRRGTQGCRFPDDSDRYPQRSGVQRSAANEASRSRKNMDNRVMNSLTP